MYGKRTKDETQRHYERLPKDSKHGVLPILPVQDTLYAWESIASWNGTRFPSWMGGWKGFVCQENNVDLCLKCRWVSSPCLQMSRNRISLFESKFLHVLNFSHWVLYWAFCAPLSLFKWDNQSLPKSSFLNSRKAEQRRTCFVNGPKNEWSTSP